MHERITSKHNEGEILKFAEKLEVLYDFFNWRWHDSDEPPTAKRIYDNIMSLLPDADKYGKCSSGGITIEKDESGYDIYFSKEYHLWIE